ncbi:basic leucine zipper 43-like [Impatiens glandulifera]|uniref:basic leucine zipper 43-like n=1 Tax=Impatiens glandulifera TaxID=253017 RepID=UPI001FB08462|nr:basic leucine zipper 43-like [Impatiens glandulifera]
MQPTNATEFHYAFPPHLNPYMSQFGLNQNDSPTFISGRFSNNFYHLQNTPQIQGFNTQPTSFSSNSTSDEADDQQLSIINERKQRRMISNRESARRSRMRKQKHLDELWSQVVSLRNENHQLIDQLNHASEYNDKVVEENAQLKEEASELRQMLIDMKLNSPCPSFGDLDDFPGDTTYLGTEYSD